MECRITLHKFDAPKTFCGCTYSAFKRFNEKVKSTTIRSFFLYVSKKLYVHAFIDLNSYFFNNKFLGLKELVLRNALKSRVGIDFENIVNLIPNLRELYITKFNVFNIDLIISRLKVIDLQKCVIFSDFKNNCFHPKVKQITLIRNQYNGVVEFDDFSQYLKLILIEITFFNFFSKPKFPLYSTCLNYIWMSNVTIGEKYNFPQTKEDSLEYFVFNNGVDWSDILFPSCVYDLIITSNNITKYPILPPKIEYLDIRGNYSERLPRNLILCNQLKHIYYDTDVIVLSLQEQRYMEFLFFKVDEVTIYYDDQNIHNTFIQQSFIESCKNLMDDRIPDYQFNGVGDEKVDMIIQKDCLNKEVHCKLLVSYKEIFQKVWNRIQSSDNLDTREIMIERLKDEIRDSDEKCFLGKVTRIVNSLVGFFDDIQIQIGSSDQILSKMRQHFETNGNIEKDSLLRELIEINVSPDIAMEYIEAYQNRNE